MKIFDTPLMLTLFEQAKNDDKAKQSEEEKTTSDRERKEKFEQLIKGEFKDLYSQKIKEIISKRLKGVEELRDRLAETEDIIGILSEKYGTDTADLASLRSKVMEDDSLLSEQAEKKGLDVNSYRYIKNLEQENRYYKNQIARTREKAQMADAIGRWHNETELVSKDYPEFDITAELENAKFIQLIKNGVDMKTAYEVTHHNDIIEKIKKSTSEEAAKAAREQMQSVNSRPVENGLSAQSPAIFKTDISKLTPSQRAEIARRVAMGEQIKF